MNRSEIYAILNRVSDLDAELQIVNIRIERMESTLQGHAIRYDQDKVQVSPSDRVADVMADMEAWPCLVEGVISTSVSS